MPLSSRAKKIIGLCAIAVTLSAFPFASSASAMGYGRGFVRAGFYPGFGWGGWGWGGWGWGPYWGDYPWYWDYTGTVKLENAAKTDAVYINGSYAGDAKKLHSIDLDPGSYHITVKNNGKAVVDQQVYILSGKTVKLEVGDKPQS